MSDELGLHQMKQAAPKLYETLVDLCNSVECGELEPEPVIERIAELLEVDRDNGSIHTA